MEEEGDEEEEGKEGEGGSLDLTERKRETQNKNDIQSEGKRKKRRMVLRTWLRTPVLMSKDDTSYIL